MRLLLAAGARFENTVLLNTARRSAQDVEAVFRALLEFIEQQGGDKAAYLNQISDSPASAYTALHWACNHGHIETARILIEAGAPLEIPILMRLYSS